MRRATHVGPRVRTRVAALVAGVIGAGLSGCLATKVVTAPVKLAATTVAVAGETAGAVVKTTGKVVVGAVRATGTVADGGIAAAAKLARAGMVTFVDGATGTVVRVPLAGEPGRTGVLQGSFVAAREGGWRIARLRYFNPVGAHPSGRIGEDTRGEPTNLFPLIGQVAAGKRASLPIYGVDWPTADGSGVRDFIHVMDLAEGHRQALDQLLTTDEQILTLNLGSGQGHSVLEMIEAFERINGCPVAYEFAPRRPGDVAESVADSTAAQQLLGWSTTRNLEDICRDGWAWRQKNRHGYRSRR
jgi:hypothetical protein